MIVYNYNPQTGELIDSAEADKSPREDDVYLIPAHATEKQPPEAGENEAAVFQGGEWRLVTDRRGTVYWMPDGSKHRIVELGVDLPEGATLNDPGPTREMVDKARRRRYSNEVDPLLNEATIKREIGEVQEAESLMQKALSARDEIQVDLPWPEDE